MGKHLDLLSGCNVALYLRRMDQPLFRFSSLAVLHATLVFFLLRARTLPRMLNWSGFHVVSRLSYGMYLNQFHVIEFIPKLKPVIGDGLFGFTICWTLSMIGSMVLAYVTFALIEVPFLRMREIWLFRSKL